MISISLFQKTDLQHTPFNNGKVSIVCSLLLLLSFIILGLILSPASFSSIIISIVIEIALFLLCRSILKKKEQKRVIHYKLLLADLLLASLFAVDFYLRWLPSKKVALIAQGINVQPSVFIIIVSCILAALAFPAVDYILYSTWILFRKVVLGKHGEIYIKRIFGLLAVSFLECLSLEFSSLGSCGIVFNKYFTAWGVNLSAALIINLCFVLIIQKARIALVIPSFLIGVWSIVNFYVIQFHGSPLYFSELVNIKTAANVAGNYHYGISVEIFCVILSFLLELQIIGYAFQDELNSHFGKRFLVRSSAILILCVCFLITYEELAANYWGWFPWDYGISRYGYFFCTAFDLEKITNPYTMPEGYSVLNLDSVEMDHTMVEPEEYPDIIFILNESFYDLGYYMDIDSDTDYLAGFYSIPGAIYGHAVSPNIGGGTNDSEFELLMSKSTYLLNGSAPFTYLSKEIENRSIVQYLENLGYKTTGMHCEAKRNYNRDTAYTAMGFDSIALGPEAFTYNSKYGNRPWMDSDNYKDLIRYYEMNKGVPQFMYLLTFQNHGGYEQNNSALDTVHTYNDYGNLTDDIDEYLSSVELSAKAFKQLTEYFDGTDRKVVICMVGDHAPSFISSLSEREMGNPISNTSINQRAVPYVIWSNVDADYHMFTNYASMVDLAPMVLKVAGVPLSVFYQTILNLHEVIPIRTSDGLYVDRELQVGLYNSESKYYDLMNQYYYMEYNSLLENEEYQGQLFTADFIAGQ